MIYLFIAIGLYTLAVLTGTAASRNANSNLVSVINAAVSTAIIAPFIVPALNKKMITDHKFGVWMAVIDGLAVGLVIMAINKSFTLNKVGIVTPIIFGGTIFLATILSYFIFKEKVTQLQFIGLLILLAGLGIVIYARATGK